MKKKTKIVIMLSSIFVIIILVNIFIFHRFYMSDTYIEKSIFNTLNCIQTNNYDDSFYYINSFGESIESLPLEPYDILTASKTEFKIISVDTDSKNHFAVAEIETSYPDIASIYVDESTFQQDLDSISKKNETISILILLHDNKWYIVENQSLLNALSGGMVSDYSRRETEVYDYIIGQSE